MIMNKLVILLILSSVALTADSALAGLDKHLADLEPYVGKTFRGEFTDAASGKSSTDVQRWEATLGGKAVRVTHSLNEGQYGGETFIFWDSKAAAVTFYYFTTGGFFTHGTMTFADGVVTAHEKVEGESGGITEVRSRSRVLEDGRLHTKSEYLKDGQWVPGHEITYVEAPEAKVIFK
jgi:hypothetical protein